MKLQESIKKTVLSCIPGKVKNWIIQSAAKDARLSYSQEGEDLLLQRFLDYRSYGVFVDVGAHHPTYINNTYYFYKQGWRGINIDPLPGTKALFDESRPGDINLEIPISDTEQELTYFMFSKPYLNTFDQASVSSCIQIPSVELIGERKIKTRTLESILEEYLGRLHHSKIDFMSVDVENWDLPVLRSNNWSKFRPEYLLIEGRGFDYLQVQTSDMYRFLTEVNYKLVAKTVDNFLFRDAQL